jgi:hypothetical protein
MARQLRKKPRQTRKRKARQTKRKSRRIIHRRKQRGGAIPAGSHAVIGMGEEQIPTVVSDEFVMDVLEDREGAFMTPEEIFVSEGVVPGKGRV